jgi:hypothetical protein
LRIVLLLFRRHSEAEAGNKKEPSLIQEETAPPHPRKRPAPYIKKRRLRHIKKEAGSPHPESGSSDLPAGRLQQLFQLMGL